MTSATISYINGDTSTFSSCHLPGATKRPRPKSWSIYEALEMHMNALVVFVHGFWSFLTDYIIYAEDSPAFARWGLLVTSIRWCQKSHWGAVEVFAGWDCREVSSWRFVPVSANTSEGTSIGFSPTQAPRRLHQYIQCFVLKEIIYRMAWPAVWVSCKSIGLYMSRFNDLLVLVSVGVSLHNAAQIVFTFWTALLCSSLQHHCIRKYSAPPPTPGLLHRICLCCMSEVSGFWLKAT